MLSEKALQLVETMTGGRKVAKRIGNVPQMSTWRESDARELRPSTVAFIKSLTAPKSDDLVGTILANRHTKKVVNHFAIASHLAGKILAKRADMKILTEAERQGGTPTVTPGTAANDGPGLSDADVQTLENVVGTVMLSPAEATKRFMEAYRVISANPTRRLTTSSDPYGVAPDGKAGDYHN